MRERAERKKKSKRAREREIERERETQLYKNRYGGLVVIPEVIDNIRSKRGTFDWLLAN